MALAEYVIRSQFVNKSEAQKIYGSMTLQDPTLPPTLMLNLVMAKSPIGLRLSCLKALASSRTISHLEFLKNAKGVLKSHETAAFLWGFFQRMNILPNPILHISKAPIFNLDMEKRVLLAALRVMKFVEGLDVPNLEAWDQVKDKLGSVRVLILGKATRLPSLNFSCDQLECLSLWVTDALDGVLLTLGNRPRLKSLCLEGEHPGCKPVVGEGLQQLFPQLDYLKIRGMRLLDAGQFEPSRLTNLVLVDVRSTAKVLLDFLRLCPGLHFLRLSRVEAGNFMLDREGFPCLEHLKGLYLNQKVTDQDLKVMLGKMPKLELLEVSVSDLSKEMLGLIKEKNIEVRVLSRSIG